MSHLRYDQSHTLLTFGENYRGVRLSSAFLGTLSYGGDGAWMHTEIALSALAYSVGRGAWRCFYSGVADPSNGLWMARLKEYGKN